MRSAETMDESLKEQTRSNYTMISIKQTGLSIISRQVEVMQRTGAPQDIIGRATALQEIAQRDLEKWTDVSARFLEAHEDEIYAMAVAEMEASGKPLNR